MLVETVRYPADVDDTLALAASALYHGLLSGLLGFLRNLWYLANILALFECALCGDVGIFVVVVDGRN
jgi:hypothetical protein